MYINITFASYGISILISIICLVFIGLIFVQKNDRSNKTYIAVRRFSIVVLLTGLLYFLFYYREIVHAQYELQLPFRLTDYTLYVLIFLCWIFVLKHMMETEKYNKIIYIGVGLSAIRFVSSIIATTFFMDVYYYIADTSICSIWTIAERIFTALTFLVIFFCCAYIIFQTSNRFRKQYVTVCTILLFLWEVIQNVINIKLFSGNYGVSAWVMETPDLTGATMFLLNLATCIFVFHEDFRPLFLDSQNIGLEDCLDGIAKQYHLTTREREILALIYEGYSNPVIGEKLFITINTVKKHTHNIFEKLQVTSRTEVIHLINAWKHS